MNVNYGSRVYLATFKTDMWEGVAAMHVGSTGHELLKIGEQCECGQLALGIVEQSRV